MAETTMEVRARREGTVWRIELNRPDCGNLVTTGMVHALKEALGSAPQDATLIVLAGGGADFCKGRDYRTAPEQASGGRAPAAARIVAEMTGPIVEVYSAIRESAVPTLSLVQGAAYGFGCALAGSCDIVLASEASRFRLPEMGRGLPPTLAMTALHDRISQRGLAYLVYSAEEIDARTAFTLGLVSAVFPHDAFARDSQAAVDAIAARAPDALRAVKDYFRHAPPMEPRARADFSSLLFAHVLSSR